MTLLISMRWSVGIVLLIASTSGCDMRGCICHETLTVRRTVEEDGDKKTLRLGHHQLGEGAEINMKIPANMNASLCVC